MRPELLGAARLVRRAWDDVWQASPRTSGPTPAPNTTARSVASHWRAPPRAEPKCTLQPHMPCRMVRFLVGAQWRAPVHGCASIAWRAEHPSPPVAELPTSFAAGVRYLCSCVVCRLTEQALPLLSVCWRSTAGERQCVPARAAPYPVLWSDERTAYRERAHTRVCMGTVHPRAGGEHDHVF